MKKSYGVKVVTVIEYDLIVEKAVTDTATTENIPVLYDEVGAPIFEHWVEVLVHAAMNPEQGVSMLEPSVGMDFAKAVLTISTLAAIVEITAADYKSENFQAIGITEVKAFLDALITGSPHPLLHHWERGPKRFAKSGGGVAGITNLRIVAENICLSVCEVLRTHKNPLRPSKNFTVFESQTIVAETLKGMIGFEGISQTGVKNWRYKWAARIKTNDKLTKAQANCVVSELIESKIQEFDLRNKNFEGLLSTIRQAGYNAGIPPNFARVMGIKK